MKLKNKGFTLVELMISMSIIAILSVVLSVSFSRAQKDGRDQRRIEDLKAIQSAAEQYYLLNNNRYPTSVGVAWTGPGAQVILQKFPNGPKTVDGVGETYTAVTLTVSEYCFCAEMENSKKGNNENKSCIYNAVNCGMTKCYYCVGSQQ